MWFIGSIGRGSIKVDPLHFCVGESFVDGKNTLLWDELDVYLLSVCNGAVFGLFLFIFTQFFIHIFCGFINLDQFRDIYVITAKNFIFLNVIEIIKP